MIQSLNYKPIQGRGTIFSGVVLRGGFDSTRPNTDLRRDKGLVYFVAADLQSGNKLSVYLVDNVCDPNM